MNYQHISSILESIRQPFTIVPDGSSQTDVNNHGRVGFFVERLFGVTPNCSRDPDLGEIEIKTIHIGRKATIGTMPIREYNRIVNRNRHYFGCSDPYKKMKKTLLVCYEKIKNRPVPEYIMHNWQLISLEDLPQRMCKTLQEDYEFICDVIKKNSKTRDELTEDLIENGCYSGDYLSLNYKGDGKYYGYNYPAWSFSASFFRDLQNA